MKESSWILIISLRHLRLYSLHMCLVVFDHCIFAVDYLSNAQTRGAQG